MNKIYCLFVLFCVVACKQQDGDYKKFTGNPLLYSRTVKRINDVVLSNNFPPVIASRNYTYANIAAYECIAAGDSSYQSLAGQLRELSSLPKPMALPVDYSLAALLAFVKVGNAVTFPEGVLLDYYEELKSAADSAGMPSEMLLNTTAFADTIAATIIKWSKGDNYAQTRSAERYTLTAEEGRWVPTPPAYTSALEPHWCDIRTMV